MTPLTIKEAGQRYCPFMFDGVHPAEHCKTSACMAWRTIHPAESREDHSGGRDMLLGRAVETNRIMHREGPPGSLGKWVLDEVGVCGRIYPGSSAP